MKQCIVQPTDDRSLRIPDITLLPHLPAVLVDPVNHLCSALRNHLVDPSPLLDSVVRAMSRFLPGCAATECRLSLHTITAAGHRSSRDDHESAAPFYQAVLPDGESVTIGRHSSCEARIKNADISLTHARLHRQGESILVCDLGSTNGTRLRGVRVSPRTARKVHNRDILTLAKQSLRIEFEMRRRSIKPIHITPAGLSLTRAPSLHATFGGTLTMILEYPPYRRIMLLDIDSSFIDMMLRSLLGTKLESSTTGSTTSLEAAILRMMAMTVLGELAGTNGQGPGVVVGPVLENPEEWLKHHWPEKELAILSYILVLEGKSFSTRLVVPLNESPETGFTLIGRDTINTFRNDRIQSLRERLKHIKIPCVLVAGCSYLTAAQLLRLKTGAVLLAARSHTRLEKARATGRVMLCPTVLTGFTGWPCECVPSSRGLELRVLRLEKEEPMAADQLNGMECPPGGVKEPDGGSESQLLAQIPVPVRIELAELALTIGQLSDLREGSCIRLDGDLRTPVRVRAGDRLIATGRLVDIDGRLGVQVLSLVGGNDPGESA
ncbi:FliM/FliN family flagellar motor switch protein [bacterium]|nr:FliM/FliN family flagellar motor switch protein [candidate division CSSED10-310 bacterium]